MLCIYDRISVHYEKVPKKTDIGREVLNKSLRKGFYLNQLGDIVRKKRRDYGKKRLDFSPQQTRLFIAKYLSNRSKTRNIQSPDNREIEEPY